MENIRKYISMQGSKSKYLDFINKLIKDIFNNEKTEDYIYIEPFIGSGVVFFNLQDNFKKYVLNDNQKEFLLIFNNFKKVNINKINKIIEIDLKKYNIENNKQGYYDFRDKYNNYKKYDEYKLISFFMLANTCINNMIRFGKNGFNQSFGIRKYSNKIDLFLECIKYCFEKDILIFEKDYYKMLKNNNKYFYFFDPPYYSDLYESSMSCKNYNSEKLHYFLINSDVKFIYFDVMHNKINNILKSDNRIKIIKLKKMNKLLAGNENNKNINQNKLDEIVVYRK